MPENNLKDLFLHFRFPFRRALTNDICGAFGQPNRAARSSKNQT
jgi:hypothetical protein